ncbi:MAG: nuclear transport factor 2 family protein [Rhodospirillaceae bacterium]|nr:nuclear transport factor 2 family protein [Rhodospirillaceae bacterium]
MPGTQEHQVARTNDQPATEVIAMTFSLPRIYWPRFILAAVFAFGLLATPAAADDKTDTARALLTAFVDGVIAGPDAVAPLLAPEYQIMRSNGVGYDRDGYINRGAGTVRARPNYSLADLVVTTGGDVMVVRYILQIDETIDGNTITRRAPRLTVFRNIGGDWKISAHGNFARTE